MQGLMSPHDVRVKILRDLLAVCRPEEEPDIRREFEVGPSRLGRVDRPERSQQRRDQHLQQRNSSK